jgi:hypothetical protein
MSERSAMRLLRVLAVFAIIAAVFVMHGMTGDHDLNPSEFSASSAASSPGSEVLVGVQGGTGTADHARPRDGTTPAAARWVGHPAGHGSAAGHGEHAAAHSCLAFLSVCALTLAALLRCVRCRILRVATGAGVSALPDTSRPFEPLGGAKPPSLTALCLSRT